MNVWSVRLTAAADADFREIVAWTAAQFGVAQAIVYAQTLSAAIEALSGGPGIAGAKARADIGEGLFTLHVKRRGAKGRHFLLCRAGDDDERVVEVLRVLHDAMDLARHVPREG